MGGVELALVVALIAAAIFISKKDDDNWKGFA